jgi:hypothetical protein
MKLTRSCRWHAAVIALISMLFMQLAVAAYACPQLTVAAPNAQDQAMQMDNGHAMSGCEKPDPVQPALCHAHGQVGKQSLDKPEPPPVHPFSAVGLAIPLHTVTTFDMSASAPVDGVSLSRTTAPPLAIRHCCFRI